jgi:hypothetical protein
VKRLAFVTIRRFLTKIETRHLVSYKRQCKDADGKTFFILDSSCRILDSEPMRLFQNYRRGEFYEPLTHRMPLKMGARVTRPSEKSCFEKLA